MRLGRRARVTPGTDFRNTTEMRTPSLGIVRSSVLSSLRDLGSASAEPDSRAKHNTAINPKPSKVLWPKFVRFDCIFPKRRSNLCGGLSKQRPYNLCPVSQSNILRRILEVRTTSLICSWVRNFEEAAHEHPLRIHTVIRSLSSFCETNVNTPLFGGASLRYTRRKFAIGIRAPTSRDRGIQSVPIIRSDFDHEGWTHVAEPAE